MDDMMIPLELESLQDLNGKSANEPSRHALKVVLLDKFVQVHAQQLERKQQVLAEDSIVMHSHDVILIIFVLLLQIAKQAKFNTCLVLEALLVTNHLDGDHGLLHVVEALKSLTKATRTQLIQNFESISKMILDNDLIVAPLIIEAEVVAQQCRSLYFVSI